MRSATPASEQHRACQACIAFCVVALMIAAFLCLGLVSLAGVDSGSENDVLISEICITGAEYIELYNQADQELSLDGWSICYYPAGRTSWNDYLNRRVIGTGIQIQPHSYLLISLATSEGWPYSTDPDLVVGASVRVSDSAGAIALFSGDPATDQPCDAIAWGDAKLAEGLPTAAPSEGQSLNRSFPQRSGMWELVDTGDNAVDFSSAAPTPSSSRIALSVCLEGTPPYVSLDVDGVLTVGVRNAGSEGLCFDLAAVDKLGWDYQPDAESITLLPREETWVPIAIHRTGHMYAALDVETTGFSSEVDEIIEIARCQFVDGEVVTSNAEVVRPSSHISEACLQSACDFTGIPIADVLAARSISEVLPDKLAGLSHQIVAAHSGTRFDERFLDAEARRIGYSIPDITWVDSCALARAAFPGLESYTLGDVSAYLGIELSPHRALADATAAGLVYWASRLRLGNPLSMVLSICDQSSVIARIQVILPLTSRPDSEL